MKDKNGRLLCKKCKEEKELVCCNDCYLEMQGWALGKVMEGDPDQRVTDSIRQLKWELEERILKIERALNNFVKILEDFKIRGLKLKSKKIKIN